MEIQSQPNPIFVVGCPRSGTDYVARWIGKAVDHSLIEDTRFLAEKFDEWELPDGRVVIKWCHLFEHADELIERYPKCLFVNVVRDPLNVLYSIVTAKPSSAPYRDFGEMRIPAKAVDWWNFHTYKIRWLSASQPNHWITVSYEALLSERERLQKRLDCELPEPSDFVNRNMDGIRLHWLNGELAITRECVS